MSSIFDSAVHRAAHLWGKEFASSLASHAKVHEGNLRRLAAHAKLGDHSKAREVQNTIIRSRSSKVTCLVRALEKSDDWTPAELSDHAATLNAFEDCGESVRGWAEQKTSGAGWRPICSFGPKRRALHLLCGDIVAAKYGISGSNYLVRKRGPDLASVIVRKLIDGGYRWFVIADIKDFYRSVQHKGLAKLTGLPQNVVMNAITISPKASVVLSPSSHPKVLNGAVRAGLPQGSGASNQIAGLLLGTMLEQFAPAGRTLYYGDDVLFAASDAVEAINLEKALFEHLEAHPCGPFRLKHSTVTHLDEGVEFLKYRYRRDHITGEVKTQPSGNSYSRYETRVRDIHFCNASDVAPGKQDIYTKRWVGSFLDWHPNDLSLVYLGITADRGADYGKSLRAIALGLDEASLTELELQEP